MPSDYGHEFADKELKKLESKLTKEYKQAAVEVEKKMKDFLSKFEEKDKKMLAKVQSGEMSAKEYAEWRKGQIMTGKRWEDMRDTLAQDLVNADKIAAGMINDSLPNAYAENMNFGTYEVESGVNIDTGFTLYDRRTVENLMKKDPQIIPQARVDIPKDELWNQKKLTSAVMQGILQGESIPNIAKRLRSVADMDRNAAIRNARTYTTAAENKGRVDSYERAKDMGIPVKQMWMATLDDRTRVEHRHLDGQVREIGEEFEADGYKIRYPGDPSAEPEMIYNCRCTLVADLPKYGKDLERNESKLGDMTYEEWKNGRGYVKEDLYMRFGGGLPVGEKSVNWLALSNQFIEENQYLLHKGKEGVEEFYNNIPDYAFESGVSAWKMGKDGFPEIDNLQGFCTLANFADSDEPLNILKGTVVGQGNDNEPTLKDVSVVREGDLKREDIKEHVYEELTKQFDVAEGEFDLEDAHGIFSFTDLDGNKTWTYGGVTFSSPKEGFDVRTGIKDVNALEQRKQEYRERMAQKLAEEAAKKAEEKIEYKWQYLAKSGFELEPFTTKTGKEGFKYVENGVLKTVIKDQKYYG